MIEILNRQRKYPIQTERLRKLLKALARHYQISNPEVTLVLVNNAEIKALNRKYRKKDSATDVLSFPLREKAADGKFYLGDIVISVPQASKQVSPQEHGLEKEIELLALHGFLHLLGYDHGQGIEEEEEKLQNFLNLE